MKRLYTSILLILLTAGLRAQNWQALSSGLGSSTTQVYAIAFDNAGGIYAGGNFPGYLRKWNGSSWSSVGGGDPNGPVYAIAVRSASDIYVGGAFTTIGGTSAKYVARIGSGGTVTALGNGFNNEVRALYCNASSGTIYAGGFFTADGAAGTTTYNHIAKLSGTSFIALGTGVNDNVYSIVEHIPVTNQGYVLYVGTDNQTTPVSKYESSTWATVNGISNGTVYALASYGGYLYAGGDFSTPTFAAARYTISGGWATTLTSFSPSSVVRSMFVRSSLLYIGGVFTNITTSNVNYIGYLTSSTGTLRKIISGGTDLNGGVYAISNQSGKVIAGGKFTAPGVNAVITDATISIDDINENVISSSVYPNPVTDRSVISIETKTRLKNPTIEIYDIQSKIVNGVNPTMIQENNKVEFILERNGLSNGTYFYIVRDEDAVVSSSKFIVY